MTNQIYRIRVGNYRVIYQVDDRNQIIRLGWVGRRREDTYRAVDTRTELATLNTKIE
ncbi:MAG: type II toxin-antitoxin system RelE/ParE family toxin [Candidatus Poribacteria bacterium]|nr:type II toxin-antitoxin system RelE/ParE family toxin [Candidatus Poribacteria bacterium]